MPDEKPAPEVNTIVISMGGRKMSWRASDDVTATVAQSLARVLGPGEEVQ